MPSPFLPPPQAEPEQSDINACFLEWLSLTLLNSPRVKLEDKIDPYLSRYEVPTESKYPSTKGLNDTRTDRAESEGEDPSRNLQSLVRLQWRGFLPSVSMLIIFMAVKKALQKASEAAGNDGSVPWAAVLFHGIDASDLCVLLSKGEQEQFFEWLHHTSP